MYQKEESVGAREKSSSVGCGGGGNPGYLSSWPPRSVSTCIHNVWGDEQKTSQSVTKGTIKQDSELTVDVIVSDGPGW